jgi:hypothetical protein
MVPFELNFLLKIGRRVREGPVRKLAGQTQSRSSFGNYRFDAASAGRDPCAVPIAAIPIPTLAKNSG